MLQSDENDPEHPSDSDGSTKGEPQVNINSPTMHLPTQMLSSSVLFLKDFEVFPLSSSYFLLV